LGRILIEPPAGFYSFQPGKEAFNNNPNEIWYLRKKLNHLYNWVPFQNNSEIPFAIVINKKEYNLPAYPARILKNGYYALGYYFPFFGGFPYPDDENGQYMVATSGFEILTCRSKKSKFSLLMRKYKNSCKLNYITEDVISDELLPIPRQPPPSSTPLCSKELFFIILKHLI
jgi:hypothetical protein